jgi:hypothetical protein
MERCNAAAASADLTSRSIAAVLIAARNYLALIEHRELNDHPACSATRLSLFCVPCYGRLGRNASVSQRCDQPRPPGSSRQFGRNRHEARRVTVRRATLLTRRAAISLFPAVGRGPRCLAKPPGVSACRLHPRRRRPTLSESAQGVIILHYMAQWPLPCATRQHRRNIQSFGATPRNPTIIAAHIRASNSNG